MAARTRPLPRPRARSAQGGALLLEALVAILIFTFGILGVIGMQAMAVQQTTDARYRTEAAQLADQLIGQMWAGNRTAANLQTQFATCFPTTGCPGFGTWFTQVQNTLPGVTTGATAPQVTVDAAGIVQITLFWKPPSDPSAAAPRNYVTSAQIQQ